jgi:hypothetical protein
VKKKKGKYPRFSGGADEATKPDLRRRKPARVEHAHDDFEIEIEVETEITAVDEPLYTGESVVTDKLYHSVDEDLPTQQTDLSDLDIKLPQTSGEEVLPLYVSSKEHLKPMPKQEMPPPPQPEQAPFPTTPLSTSDKQDILDLFDDPRKASLSNELPPIHDAAGPPVQKPDEFQIVRPGESTGVRPLDGDKFDSDRRFLRPWPSLNKSSHAAFVSPCVTWFSSFWCWCLPPVSC